MRIMTAGTGHLALTGLKATRGFHQFSVLNNLKIPGT
jgi:hypothetical protein